MRVSVIGSTGALLLCQPCVASDDDIMFAAKNYYESTFTPGQEYVSISGTLTGEGVGWPNNTYALSCFQDRKECFISSIEQIAKNHIGRLENPYSYPITKWTAYEVVVTEESGVSSCSKVTITITRKSQSALWVQEPINQTTPFCAKSDTKIYKWTIEDSLGWKRINKK